MFLSNLIFTTTEKVHFQHTAKFINYLISEKANYTLQVGCSFWNNCWGLTEVSNCKIYYIIYWGKNENESTVDNALKLGSHFSSLF